jgi:hypothetical protein
MKVVSYLKNIFCRGGVPPPGIRQQADIPYDSGKETLPLQVAVVQIDRDREMSPSQNCIFARASLVNLISIGGRRSRDEPYQE